MTENEELLISELEKAKECLENSTKQLNIKTQEFVQLYQMFYDAKMETVATLEKLTALQIEYNKLQREHVDLLRSVNDDIPDYEIN